mgnify:CR=1 FL=1
MTGAHSHSYSRKLLPPLSALMAFDASARTGSFTLAANELFLTQGAVSRQILLLEGLLGIRLFERVRKRVVLTPAGAFYAERVRDALAALATATAQTMASRGKGGILRLGVLPAFGNRWLIGPCGSCSSRSMHASTRSSDTCTCSPSTSKRA